MALRVLLADESATIKKVIQLSLQDFAVELKTVNLGVDVLQVAQNFKPDIILVDILLQKLNGYEVCKQIKTTPELINIPIVLMWSGFMSIDEAQFHAVKADAKLEKPFDAQSLRKMVSNLVPKLEEQDDFHQHIDVPDIATETIPKAPISPPPIDPPQLKEELKPPPIFDPEDEPTKSWDMDSFEQMPEADTILPEVFQAPAPQETGLQEGEEFQIQQLRPEKTNRSKEDETLNESEDPWVNESISKFKLNIPDLEDTEPDNSDVQQEDINDTSFLWTPEDSGIEIVNEAKLAEENIDEDDPDEFSQIDLTNSTKDKQNLQQPEVAVASSSQIPMANLDPKLVEQIIEKHAKQIIEEVVWKVVPELATTMIQKEIERLTKDAET